MSEAASAGSKMRIAAAPGNAAAGNQSPNRPGALI
jgi:hypothetical protein